MVKKTAQDTDSDGGYQFTGESPDKPNGADLKNSELKQELDK